MQLKWIDICDRFIPLLINLIYIILLSFNVKIEGFNILVNSNYFIATYVYLGLIITNYVVSLILHRSYYFRNRSFLFFLFLALGLAVSPKLGGYQYFHTFILLFSVVDLLAIMYKMVSDSYYTEERLKNMVLPPNQFNNSRKILSRILDISGFVLFFILCFIVFYYNEAKVTSILILLLIGLLIVSIIQIISMSVSISPLNKFIKKYERDLNMESFKDSLESLKDEKLHKETLNLMNILLWKYYSFIDMNIAEKYKDNIFKPSYDNINKVYYDAYFYYLLQKKSYEMIITNEKIFIKNVKNKQYVKAIISVLHNNYAKYKPKKVMFDALIYPIYTDLSSKLQSFSDFNYIKFNNIDLENVYKEILLDLSKHYSVNEYKDILDRYNTVNNKIVGATKLANIKLFKDYNYYDEYIYNIKLLYNNYPTITDINKLIVTSRFNNKAKDLYGPYYNKHLMQFDLNDNYSLIKDDIIKIEEVCYNNSLSKLDKLNEVISLRNKISKTLGYESYLDILYENNITDIFNDIDINSYNDDYTINLNYDLSNIKDKLYKEYLSYLKKYNLYSIDSGLLNYTYYINNYRAPYISINRDTLDYNKIYFELGKGFAYYLNNSAYIPRYLLNLMGYINTILATGKLDYVVNDLRYNYNLYKQYNYIYLNNCVTEEFYEPVILDVNPIEKIIASYIVIKLFEGKYNLLKVFIGLNRNLYKTSEKEIFGSLGLLDVYDKYIKHSTK